MTVKELYTEALLERGRAKRLNDITLLQQADALIALIDELKARQFLTWNDDTQKIQELHERLKHDPAANERTNVALRQRIERNRERWGERKKEEHR
ncbi:hypothetical protein ACWS7L_08205 [Exiguobacterium artemiae]